MLSKLLHALILHLGQAGHFAENKVQDFAHNYLDGPLNGIQHQPNQNQLYQDQIQHNPYLNQTPTQHYPQMNGLQPMSSMPQPQIKPRQGLSSQVKARY